METHITPDLVDKIYYQVANHQLPELLVDLSELLHVTDIAIYTAPPEQNRFASVISGHIDKRIHANYLDYYQYLDTQIKRLLSSKDLNFITGSDLSSFNEIKHCPVHNEYLAPNKIDSQLVYYLPSKRGFQRTFVAMKNSREGNFSQAQLTSFKRIAHLFKRSFDVYDSIQDKRDQNLIASCVYSNMNIGVVVLNQNAKIIFQNAVFSELLRNTQLLSTRKRKLFATRNLNRQLQHLLNSAFLGISGNIIVKDDKNRIHIRALPFNTAYSKQLASIPYARIILVFKSQPIQKQFRYKSVQKNLKITPAEARLAAHLANGGTTTDYRNIRNLSVHTVRNQLKSIFSKIGVSSQKDLVARIFETEV